MATTTNFGWETPDDTDLVKDGALAIRTLGSAIDTSLVDLKGGTTGQVLSKTSNTDMDFTWINNDQGDITEVQAGTGISVASGTGPIPVVTNTVATAFDAKGDLVVGTGADTFSKLTVGTNGHVLTADSTTATGLKWAAAAGGGKVLQVVQTTKTDSFSSNSTTYVDITGMSATITPAATSSKILVFINFGVLGGSETQGLQLKLLRGSTVPIQTTTGGGADTNNAFWSGLAPSTTNDRIQATANLTYLDSPSSTSALTYKVQMRQTGSAQTGYVNRWALNSDVGGCAMITLMEIGA